MIDGWQFIKVLLLNTIPRARMNIWIGICGTKIMSYANMWKKKFISHSNNCLYKILN